MSPPRANSKFTRGEKCIFVHLFITFLLILVMIITYFLHLCLVKHSGNEMFRVYRRSFQNEDSHKPKDSNTFSVGVLYTNQTKNIICHTLLLRQEWSLAPAHCIAIRSDPNMAYLLNTWSVKYIYKEYLIMETPVKRTAIHAQFNRDDFENNIGLIEHIKPIMLREYSFAPNQFIQKEKMLRQYNIVHGTEIVGWDFSRTRRGKQNFKQILHRVNGNSLLQSETLIKKLYTSSVMTKEKCNNVISPILNQLRDYELCVTIKHDYNEDFLYHGAILASESKAMGFYSWGDKRNRGLPYIILNFEYYKNWLENVMKI